MQSVAHNQQAEIHWLSVAQLALSALAIFILWAAAAAVALLALGGLSLASPAAQDLLSSMLMAATAGVGGLLLLPSAIYAFLRVIGRPASRPGRSPAIVRPTVLIFLLPVVILLGNWVSGNPSIAWLFLPPLHVLAIGLPVWWLLYLGVRGLPFGSLQRRWGVFGSGLVLGPALILVAELAAILAFAVIGVIWLSGQPQLAAQFTALLQQLQSSNASTDQIIQALIPYLASPVVIVAVFVFGSVIVPLIEEFFKPIGVWLLVGRDLTPAAGLAAGLMSGAGYALFESLALTSSGGDWALLVVARIGTAVVHITTAGLTGWALTQAWRQGRYVRLAVTYLTAVLIHGLWNGLTLTSVFAGLGAAQASFPQIPLISRLGSIAPIGLVLLTLVVFAIMLHSNRVMRRTAQPEPASELPGSMAS
ncbi:MAG TPA: PrsW family glutamic-type intramembrane protease [Anaerolineales bacterium]